MFAVTHGSRYLPTKLRTPTDIVLAIVARLKSEQYIPSHPSGSFAASRSSIENLTSLPFSIRDSGSAFISLDHEFGVSLACLGGYTEP